MTPPDKHSQRTGRRKRTPLWPVLLLLVAAAAGAGLYLISFRPVNQPTGTGTEKLTVPAKPTAPGTTSAEKEKNAVAAASKPAPEKPVEQISRAPGVAPAPPEIADQPAIVPPAGLEPGQQCTRLAGQLHTFFSQLDQKEYIRAFDLGQPAQNYFLALGAKLLDNPPVVSRESDDLYTILTNMAHFFRVIGRRNILIMKAILDRERAKIEDVQAELYQWIILGSCSDDQLHFRAPLTKVYEYAGFFLNTLGGRSYLFRRDSGTRLLVNYYSILIIDRANDEGFNRYGIDLSRILPQLAGEIESTNQLIYRETYLNRLYDLMEKYPPHENPAQTQHTDTTPAPAVENLTR